MGYGAVGGQLAAGAPHPRSSSERGVVLGGPHYKTGCLPRKVTASVPALMPARLSHHSEDQRAAASLGHHPNDGGVVLPTPPKVWQPYLGNPDNQMLGNDVVGDCVAACMGHYVNLLSYWSGGPVLVNTPMALEFYQTISRWNGHIGDSSDLGSYIVDALQLMILDGLAGYKINAFAELKQLYFYSGAPFGFVTIDKTNTDYLKQCVYDFGAVVMGLQLPFTALTKFHAGQPWTLGRNDALDGGHCILLVGWDAQYAHCYTYGQVVKVAWDFITFYVYETHVLATDLLFDTKVFSKYNRNQLNDEWAQVTGHGDDPF